MRNVTGHAAIESDNVVQIQALDDDRTYEVTDGERCLGAIKFQDGPIGEVGRNGLMIEHVIAIALDRIWHFQKIKPCRENSIAIMKLEEAINYLHCRTRDRAARGVEGTSQA